MLVLRNQQAATPAEIEVAAAQVLEAWRAERPEPPTFPGVARRIIEVLKQPNTDVNRLVAVLRQDVATAVRLLAVANSALYAGSGTVESIRAAVVRLGLREVARISLGLAGGALFNAQSRREHALFPDLWAGTYHEALTCALGASALAASTRQGDPDRAFLAGLLCDIGKPVALRALIQLRRAGVLTWAMDHGAVGQIIDAVHVELGAAAVASWNLPAYLHAVVARHHEPVVSGEPALIEVHLVRVVSATRALAASTISAEQHAILRQSAAVLRLDRHRLRATATEVSEVAGHVSELLGVPDPLAWPRR
jgi:HD-like signal output (HDOD) protein